MIVLITPGNHIIIIAGKHETVPLVLENAADLVVVGDRVDKNRWAK